ncbi:MAG: hypothetical protein J2P15_12195 [Micromonosporaceae bacterium]|nr:hypothetical protein [Micromonosporaceae bacterium]
MESSHGHYDADGQRLGAEAMRRLRRWDVCAIEAGLTGAEIHRVETEFGFQFSDDHRVFLAAGLPVNTRPVPRVPGVIYTHPKPWPDWRSDDSATLRRFMEWPVEGVLFDVEHNGFWHDGWEPRPDERAAALQTARRMLADVPRMVPIYGHRYLPAGRGTFGHPVLSMWQTDIIYYGLDLADYIDREFGGADVRRARSDGTPQSTVNFWHDLAD